MVTRYLHPLSLTEAARFDYVGAFAHDRRYLLKHDRWPKIVTCPCAVMNSAAFAIVKVFRDGCKVCRGRGKTTEGVLFGLYAVLYAVHPEPDES